MIHLLTSQVYISFLLAYWLFVPIIYVFLSKSCDISSSRNDRSPHSMTLHLPNSNNAVSRSFILQRNTDPCLTLCVSVHHWTVVLLCMKTPDSGAALLGNLRHLKLHTVLGNKNKPHGASRIFCREFLDDGRSVPPPTDMMEKPMIRNSLDLCTPTKRRAKISPVIIIIIID